MYVGHRAPAFRRPRAAFMLEGVAGVHRHRRRVRVVGEQPVESGVAIGLRLVPGRDERGMFAGQVVELVPVRGGFLQQVRVEQLTEQPPGAGQVAVEQRGCRVQVQVRSGMQADEPVGALLACGQLPVGQVEGRRDTAFSSLQLEQTLLAVGQPVDEMPPRPAAVRA